MDSAIYISFVAIGTVFAAIFMFLLLAGAGQYKEYINAIDKEKNRIREIYYIGFRILNWKWIGFTLENEKSRKFINEIAALKGSLYAEFYYYVMRAGQVTHCLIGLTVSFLISGILGVYGNDESQYVLLISLFLTALSVYIKEDDYHDEYKKRALSIEMELPTVLSKMTLLVNAGMILRDAWKRVAYSSDGPIYIEMQSAVEDMSNGMGEIEAYKKFADRCNVKSVRKFTSTIIQNLQKGGRELVLFLSDMSEEMWNEKALNAKKLGDNANLKLMGPMVMTFVGILVMIIAPMLLGMNL